MSRVRINQYKPSKSAKALSEYLGIKRLKTRGSTYRGRSSDVVINWGNGKGNVGNARQINKLENIQLASNKLSTFDALDDAGVTTPRFTYDATEIEWSGKTIGRATLYGHSGEGIEVFEDIIPNTLPLYVEYIEKVAEYRVIVVGDTAVDTKKKLKKSSPRDEEGNVIEEERIEHDPHVWNLEGGYIMARQGFEVTDELKQLGIDAIKALGLDFGAVDIIEDEEGKLYVLEINTAFGLEGTTISLVGDALLGLMNQSSEEIF